jgi:renalase
MNLKRIMPSIYYSLYILNFKLHFPRIAYFMKKRIAIVGAGISGLTIAQKLKDHADIVVYEKSRGVGGRMSTRYADPFYFDHGTQFFTARTLAFQNFIGPLITKGVIAEWKGKVVTYQADKTLKDRLWFEPHYVAVPHMNSLSKHMAEDIDVRLNTEIAALTEKRADGWHLLNKEGATLGVFDWVISTAPPTQTLRLFQSVLPADSALHNIKLQGCYTLMIGFHTPWHKPWMAAKAHESPIEWIAINSTKPGRNKDITTIVIHSRNEWADQHIDDDLQQTQDYLVQQFENITGIACDKPDYLSMHRWRYANVIENQTAETYLDAQQNIAAIGDWASASRIEAVWLNAVNLAKDIAKIII